jgi:hypothetical protein
LDGIAFGDENAGKK